MKLRPQVYIVGSLQITNEAIAFYIRQKLRMRCTCRMHAVADNSPHHERDASLVLYDYKDYRKKLLRSNGTAQMESHEENGCFTALFNVEPNRGIENQVLLKGVRGVFYKDDSLEMIRKGVKAILEGNLWFSRDIMADFLLQTTNLPTCRFSTRARRHMLTDRERQILNLLSSGCSNVEISEHLCVSPHTVKTHLYNIYKKIKTPNRVQAILWAAKHLSM